MNHYTAWLVNSPTELATNCMDVTILQDEATSYQVNEDTGEETPVWASNGPLILQAITSVDARNGNIEDGKKDAEELMREAGWRTRGKWQAVDNAYTITVEKDDE